MIPKPQSESRQRCSHGVAWNGRLCKQCHPELVVVFVPLTLARRILSALEASPLRSDGYLADALRPLVERRK